MYFTSWNGEAWSRPFQPNELHSEPVSSGLHDIDGQSIAWDADGFRGENWIALRDWSEERAQEIMLSSKNHHLQRL